MFEDLILGAGPYGLAAAAHLRAAGVKVSVFGEPMSFWQEHMPAGMLLRSPRVASSISDPRGELDLDAFGSAAGVPVGAPVPLDRFVEYGHWFQDSVAPDVDRRRVSRLERSGGRFQVTLEDGERFTSDRVVVATGIAPFAHIPRAFTGLPRTVVSHTSHHTDLARFSGRRVLVVGGGQSALESAALLHEGGAEVEVVTRAPLVRWLGQHPWIRSLGPVSALLVAPTEVGPPLLSQLVRVPGCVYRLPAGTRRAADTRSIRPAGAEWLKQRVDGVVPLRTGSVVTGVEAGGDGAVVTFQDGRRETFAHVLLGTGYRVDLTKYPFLSPDLLAEVRQVNGYPVLNSGFESSVPGLHFLGAASAWAFGPLVRFVAGTPFSAAALTRFVTSSRRRPVRRSVARI